MATLRRVWLLAMICVVLAVSLAEASAPTVSVTLTGPDEGWYDDALTFSASGSFTLDGDTQKEVVDGQATVSDQYSWSYSPAALVSGGGAHDSYVTVRYLEQQAGQTYTVSVTYTVTITYGDGTSDSGSATASKDVFIKGPQISVSTSRSAICAGGIASAPHQATITAWVRGKDGAGVGGCTVDFSADHQYYQVAPSFSQTQVTTGADGRAETVLTSGDGVVSGEVKAEYGTSEATTSVAFGEPDMAFELLDPVSGEPLEYLMADGASQVRVVVQETYDGAPIAGHDIQWTFQFWTSGDPNGEADYHGTGLSPFGGLTPTSRVTNALGKSDTIYTIGTVGGYIMFTAKDHTAFTEGGQ